LRITGTVAIARSLIRPSRSSDLRTWLSIFCEMPSMVRRNALKRIGSSRTRNRMSRLFVAGISSSAAPAASRWLRASGWWRPSLPLAYKADAEQGAPFLDLIRAERELN
jgi:hypothetical protein